MKRIVVAVPCLLIALSACGGGSTPGPGASSTTGGTAASMSFYRDMKPIFDAKCVTCHVKGGIAPFTLDTYASAHPYAGVIKAKVTERTMPPWPPGAGCSDYYNDRSLTDAQIHTIGAWVDEGAPEGDPKDVGAPIVTEPQYGLSRVDLNLPLPVEYTPQSQPDDYHCFVIDWPNDKTAYVTGFRANPGNAAIVHHVIAFLAKPADVPAIQKLDAAEPGPGYTCFGGTGSNSSEWLGAWAPGSPGSDFPVGTGIRVEPGSKVVLQVHYNTLTAGKQPDRTSVDFKLDTAVAKEAHIQPWTNPQWLSGPTMKIAAFDADASHAFSLDPTPYVTANKAFTMYSANLHMHTLGTHAEISIERKDGTKECMLQIPKWNFHWQGSYGFKTPKVFNPGDKINLECHWDNSPKNQPMVGGAQGVPKDVFWGERTSDEMCLGGFYMTEN